MIMEDGRMLLKKEPTTSDPRPYTSPRPPRRRLCPRTQLFPPAPTDTLISRELRIGFSLSYSYTVISDATLLRNSFPLPSPRSVRLVLVLGYSLFL